MTYMSDIHFLYLNIGLGAVLLSGVVAWVVAELKEQKRKRRKDMLESALQAASEYKRTEK